MIKEFIYAIEWRRKDTDNDWHFWSMRWDGICGAAMDRARIRTAHQ